MKTTHLNNKNSIQRQPDGSDFFDLENKNGFFLFKKTSPKAFQRDPKNIKPTDNLIEQKTDGNIVVYFPENWGGIESVNILYRKRGKRTDQAVTYAPEINIKKIVKGSPFKIRVKTALVGIKEFYHHNDGGKCKLVNFEFFNPVDFIEYAEVDGEEDTWDNNNYSTVYENLTETSPRFYESVIPYLTPASQLDFKVYNTSQIPDKSGEVDKSPPNAKTLIDSRGEMQYGADTYITKGTVSTYFNSSVETLKGGKEMNDLGRALNVVHEGMHANWYATKTKEFNSFDHHRSMVYEWKNLADTLKEFTDANNFDISYNDLLFICLSGLINNNQVLQEFQFRVEENNEIDHPVFKKYPVLVELAKVNSSHKEEHQALLDKYNAELNTIIYNDKSQPDRYNITKK